MSYKLRIVFSGPCAYVPNIIEGDPGPAETWSVMVPNLREGWPGDDDGIAADRHLPVLIFSLEDFDCSDNPDTMLFNIDDNGIYQQTNFFILRGHRINLDLPGADPFSAEDYPINSDLRESVDGVRKLIESQDPRIRSLDWLPAMKWLDEDLQWFGRKDVDYFRPGGLYPEEKVLAAYAVLTGGRLITDQIDTVATNRGFDPTIWEFRPYCKDSSKRQEVSVFRKQALAKSIALEVVTCAPPCIELAYSDEVKTKLTVRADRRDSTVTVQIKNRELEEIFLIYGRESETSPIDFDFRYLFSHSSNYNPTRLDYPIPHYIKGGGGAGERATCGGHKSSGFSKILQPFVRR